MENVVVLGGGTGSYVTLLGLKRHSNELNLTAIVTVADSGGSAKQERDEFGLLPVSDVRKALIALARDSDERRQWILREIFNYRFVNGQAGLKGGTFGNLLLVVLSNILGSEQAAIEPEHQARAEAAVVDAGECRLAVEVVGMAVAPDHPAGGGRGLARELPQPPGRQVAQIHPAEERHRQRPDPAERAGDLQQPAAGPAEGPPRRAREAVEEAPGRQHRGGVGEAELAEHRDGPGRGRRGQGEHRRPVAEHRGAAEILESRLRRGEFRPQPRRRLRGERAVVLAMRGQLVAPAGDLPHQVGRLARGLAEDEEAMRASPS